MARRADTGGLEGVLIVNKPAGPTSHDVVALVRRLSGTRRVGHGGTLDPFASGVLPLFLGGATRLVEYHLGDRKRYRATVCFAASSTTDDLDGELTPVVGPILSSELVTAALESFRGPISQRPPVYSAIQVGGRRAYALARDGSPQELPERNVTIHGLDLVAWNADDPARPIAILDVECSAGTYIRAIARDLGSAVASAAYLGALTRTASGAFGLGAAIGLDALRAAATDGPTGLTPMLLPADAGLEAMASVSLTSGEIRDARMGRFVRPESGLAGVTGMAADAALRLLDASGRIVGIGVLDGRRIAPSKMLAGINEPAGAGKARESAGASPGAAESAEFAGDSTGA